MIKDISGSRQLFTVTRLAQAVIITYQATDLPDAVAGEDIWCYQCPVSGYTFAANSDFTITFDIADGFSAGGLEKLAMPAY